ncbi:MAG: electron transfer flavoprotein subunit beta/FixA family protein [Gemmatimonadota bacterium]
MKSIVCIKRVPDSEARIRVGGDGVGIDPAGVKYVMNPYDELALEEAIRLKEEAGDGLVTVLSVGPEESKEILRTALAMGADAALLLASPGSADGLVIARALAEEIGDREYDLILFGKQAIDDDNMQVPAMVAELLGLPCASVVVELEIEGRHAVAHREVEGGHEIVEFDLPAVVGAQKGLNEPRYPSLKGIMAAKKKPLDVKEIGFTEPKVRIVALQEPPPRAGGEIVGEGPKAVPELVRRLRDRALI